MRTHCCLEEFLGIIQSSCCWIRALLVGSDLYGLWGEESLRRGRGGGAVILMHGCHPVTALTGDSSGHKATGTTPSASGGQQLPGGGGVRHMGWRQHDGSVDFHQARSGEGFGGGG